MFFCVEATLNYLLLFHALAIIWSRNFQLTYLFCIYYRGQSIAVVNIWLSLRIGYNCVEESVTPHNKNKIKYF